MGMGVFAAISGAIKTSKLYESIESDVTWDSYDLFQWNGAETFLIIVCGCLPTLKPIYDCCLGRKLSSKSKCSSYHHPSGSRVSKKYFWNVSGNSDLESQRQSAIILEPQRAALRDTKDRIHVAHRIDVDVSSRRSGDDDEINNIGRGTSEWERDGHQGLRGVRYAASWDKIGEEGV
ncbi:MAG: hypothetical protein MMC33_006581 [Icmadophila ericetorum]|nr:hypothetical protein [Icmadophila ericetorum]